MAFDTTGFEQADSRYIPIPEHGLIGDLRTTALVGTNGTIDWYCCPRFDAPSVFGSILDADRGGSFELAAEVPTRTRQFYFPDTNVLITRFFAADGVAEIQDFMPVIDESREAARHRLIRRVICVRELSPSRRGSPPLRLRRRSAHHAPRRPHGGVPLPVTDAGADRHRTLESDGLDVWSHFKLLEGESNVFALDQIGDDVPARSCPRAEAQEQAEATVRFWRRWLAGSRYHGRWRETVNRSALVLKLLTYAPTGAIVAAPTTSLPEQIGGERNWDYRYVWVRDAAFCVYAMLRLGFTSEAEAFMGFISERGILRGTGRAVRCRSCTASTGAASCPSTSCRTWRATSAPHRSGWATPPPASSSWTSTVR